MRLLLNEVAEVGLANLEDDEIERRAEAIDLGEHGREARGEMRQKKAARGQRTRGDRGEAGKQSRGEASDVGGEATLASDLRSALPITP